MVYACTHASNIVHTFHRISKCTVGITKECVALSSGRCRQESLKSLSVAIVYVMGQVSLSL